MMSMQQSVIAVVTMYYIAVVQDKVFKMVTRQGLKNAKVNTNCDIEIAFYGTSLSAKTGQITHSKEKV